MTPAELPGDGPALLRDEEARALSVLGVTPVEIHDVTALRSRSASRSTLRIVTAGGWSLKVRRYSRPAKVRLSTALRRRLSNDRLPRILLFTGRVLVEEWIEGISLADLPLSSARLEQAADLLGGLHATRDVGGRPLPTLRPVRPLLRRAERHLARLADAAAVSHADHRRISRGLARFAPTVALVGVAHHDFCAENLVEDRSGRLLAVDNEHMRLGFLDFDLARTWYRWPMPEETWERFQDRYEAWRGPSERQSASFWRFAALLGGAYTRLVRLGGARIDVPLGKLRELAGSLG